MKRTLLITSMLLGAAVLGAQLLTHRALRRTRGFTYVGRHQQQRGCLSTMEASAWSVSAKHAEKVALDVHRRWDAVIDEDTGDHPILPRRVPGKTLVANMPRPVEYVEPSDETVQRVHAALVGAS